MGIRRSRIKGKLPASCGFGTIRVGRSVLNTNNEYAAGFAWRRADRTSKRGNWLVDLAVALAISVAATLLCMIGDAHAQQRLIQIAGANRTVMVTVTIGKSQDVRTETSFVDISVGDPTVAD